MARKSIAGVGVIALVMLIGAHGASAQNAAIDQIHSELRALKDRAVDAVNKRNKDALLKELAPNITFTSISNDLIQGVDRLGAYYDQNLTSPNRLIGKMTLTVEPDALSQLYADNRIAVAFGKADAHFEMVAGSKFDWPLRWTATLTNSGGKWSVVALHFSGNAIENPLMAATSAFLRWVAVGTGVAGLLIGLIIGWRRGRRASA
jgi:hypothetical protein